MVSTGLGTRARVLRGRHTHRVPAGARRKAVGPAAGIGSGGDVVEARNARRVNERVKETQRRLALREPEIVEERNHSGEGLLCVLAVSKMPLRRQPN